MKISKAVVEKHGLKPDEYLKIKELLAREPNLLELGIFSAMWNEHCSYKSSRIHLKNLPTKGKHVIQGPGENAGVIDIGDDDAIIFKIESHNHPSYIEPYQGAATGVGGILRDVYSKAKGLNKSVVYVGSKTGRDGIHGASMASAEFDENSENKKPTVQVGDPFTEKLLMEACLELMKDNSIISIQDMGAAGLTSSSVEMASKGDLGMELYLDKVPCREENMTPYEMMLSESQERMLIILEDKGEKEARKIFEKWDLDFVVIGKTTSTNNLTLKFKEETIGEIPIDALASKAPIYDRKWTKTKLPTKKILIKDLKNIIYT